MSDEKLLLCIVEIGGYPDFTRLYQARGFRVETADSMRKAVKMLKKNRPALIMAEFNFQSDFRDRTSSLETLMATVQRMPDTRVIVFYEQEQRAQLQRLLNVFEVDATLSFPIDEQLLADTIDRLMEETA
jgi:DNA-binding NarL/FixJ family response regulator